MKNKPQVINNMSIKSTAKVFRLNVNEGIAEGNTVQTPFIAEYKGERITAIEYVWSQKLDGGKIVKRGIYVSGHGEYGVPTLREQDVLVALQRIFVNKKTKNGVIELKTENITDDDLTIQYTINELARELGYNTPNEKCRENLKKSVRMLVATTIFNRFDGGLYDVRTKQYIKNPEVAFHYLESMEGYEIEDENGKDVDITKIKLSKFTYDMMVNNFNLFYNKIDLNKTKNFMARKIYQMALQWKGDKNFAWAYIDTLVEKLPMKQEEHRHKKQYVKRALSILEESEMCKIVYDDNAKDKVYFVFDNSDEVGTEVDIMKKFNTYKEIKEGFRGLGFIEEEIDTYLDVENIRYIQALLRFCHMRMKYENIISPKKYFLKYLTERYPVDDKYYNKAE